MTTRPDTARSEISSAISDDGLHSPPPPTSDRAMSTTPGPPASPYGFTQFRGVTNPTNRSLRSPPPPSTTSGTSRPQSPEGSTSRTHVPSLTAQGFLRPMSSSRLQQQRLDNLKAAKAARDRSRPQTGAAATNEDDDDTQSVHSTRTGPYASLPRQHRATASITTGYTESEAPDNNDTLPHQALPDPQNEYFRAQSPDKKGVPSPLDLTAGRGNVGQKDKPMRSPHSFRSGFSIGSRQIIPGSHQQLPSTEPSPRYEDAMQDMHEKQYIAQQSAGGKNYEYFEGNNCFWWGGRMQNARDRPINILTGLLVVVPSVLFFVFS